MDRPGVLIIAVSAREQRRIETLERRVDDLDRKINALLRNESTDNRRKILRLLAKQRAALAEWNRLRWPR